MKILHVIAGLSPESGAATVVEKLAGEQQSQGHAVVLAYTQEDACGKGVKPSELRVKAYARSFPRALCFSWQMAAGLPELVADANVVHIHSDWTFPVWWAGLLAVRHKKTLVMSPHGALDPVRLKHSRWKKQLVGWMDRALLRRADVIHATSKAEKVWTEAFLRGSHLSARADVSALRPSVVVIPNGVDVASLRQGCEGASAEETEEGGASQNGRPNGAKQPGDGRVRRFLYLGRLHPLKGLDLLISAWAEVRSSRGKARENTSECASFWQLVIAGPDEQGTRKELLEQARRLRLGVEGDGAGVPGRPSISHSGDRTANHSGTQSLPSDLVFSAPAFGDDKASLMASADVFVLPTRSENFGIVVAEALACGLPVITTKAAPWPELLGRSGCTFVGERPAVGGRGRRPSAADGSAAERRDSRTDEREASGRCGWWVDVGVEPLARALREAMCLTDTERNVMGANGRRLVEQMPRWSGVAERLVAAYHNVPER